MHIKFRLSIQAKIIFSFALLTVAIFLCVGIIFFTSVRSTIIEAKQKEMLTLSAETGNKIERFLFERHGDISVMSQSPLLKDPAIGQHYKDEYLDSVRLNYQTYDYILITNMYGKPITVSGEANEIPNTSDWLNFVRKGSIYVSDLIYSDARHSYGMFFAAPLRNNHGYTGTVTELMDFHAIFDIVGNVKLGKQGYAFLIDKKGNIITPTNPNIQKSYPKDALKALLPKLNNSPQITTYKKNGRLQLAAVYPLKNYPTQRNRLYVVLEQPNDEAFAVLDKLHDYLVLIIVFSVSVLFLLGTLLSELITKPIKRLLNHSNNILAGDIYAPLSIQSSDEISSIAKSFNTLTENLQETMKRVLEISGEAAALTEIRDYFESFFDEIPAAMLTVDRDGTITLFNPSAEQLTGFFAADIVDQNINDEHLAPLRHLLIPVSESLEHNMPGNRQVAEITNAAGKSLSIIINTTLYSDPSGQVLGVIAIFRSVDEIRRIEADMARAKSLASLGEMAAGMAHEIRNPLTSIRGFAQYVQGELRESGVSNETDEDISRIISEVDRLNEIIMRFTSFASPTKPDFHMTNLSKLLSETIGIMRSESSTLGIELISNISEISNPICANVDEHLMSQVFFNVILNAIQAMPKGGQLETTLSETADKRIEIAISDTGDGIPPESRDDIFKPFYTTKNNGCGLGLAITARIIENHNGRIEIKDTIPHGTTVVISIPTNNT